MYNKDIYPALQTFGIEHLRDEQERALTPILAGRDVLVRLRTGGGKSLLYHLPALLDEPGSLTLVFSPLRALQRDQVQALERRGVHDPKRLLFPIRRKNVKIYVKKITIRDKTGKTRKLQNARLIMLDNVLRKYHKHGATIIYCPRVKDVKRTTKWLRSLDYPVKAYYGKMKRCKRAHVQDYFLTKKRPIIVATNAFGLGIDAYTQEIGRAGRDGKKARAVPLYAPSDEYVVKNLIHSSRDPETVSRGKKRLKAPKKVLREPNKVWKGITKYFR